MVELRDETEKQPPVQDAAMERAQSEAIDDMLRPDINTSIKNTSKSDAQSYLPELTIDTPASLDNPTNSKMAPVNDAQKEYRAPEGKTTIDAYGMHQGPTRNDAVSELKPSSQESKEPADLNAKRYIANDLINPVESNSTTPADNKQISPSENQAASADSKQVSPSDNQSSPADSKQVSPSDSQTSPADSKQVSPSDNQSAPAESKDAGSDVQKEIAEQKPEQKPQKKNPLIGLTLPALTSKGPIDSVNKAARNNEALKGLSAEERVDLARAIRDHILENNKRTDKNDLRSSDKVEINEDVLKRMEEYRTARLAKKKAA